MGFALPNFNRRCDIITGVRNYPPNALDYTNPARVSDQPCVAVPGFGRPYSPIINLPVPPLLGYGLTVLFPDGVDIRVPSIPRGWFNDLILLLSPTVGVQGYVVVGVEYSGFGYDNQHVVAYCVADPGVLGP